MSRDRRALGGRGEALAAAFLERKGYRILARNYRARFGELDLVAADGGCIVFVEVKTRRGDGAGRGEDAVTPLKRARLARLARHYLLTHGLLARPCRFDVVALAVRPGHVRISLVRDAFHLA